MIFVIVKYVGQFRYYLDNNNEWTGLSDNAKLFLSSSIAQEKNEILKYKYDSTVEQL